MSTAAEQEAGRIWATKRDQIIFVRGAEWALEQYRELLEAAEAYRAVHIPRSERDEETGLYFSIWLADLDAADALEALIDAAAALNEEGGE